MFLDADRKYTKKNILRIFFWIGHPFELPLLAQSIVMITCMLVTLELCVRVKAEGFNALNPNCMQTKKLTGKLFFYFLV